MAYLLCSIAAVVISWDLAASLKNRSAIFYGAAAALCADQLAALLLVPHSAFEQAASLFIGNGLLSFCLFAVVMFTGCFKPGSKIRKRLMQVREPLASTASILAIGHILFIGVEHDVDPRLGSAFVPACVVLAILLIVLGGTSIPRVREDMGLSRWKKTQRLAYVFFLVACLHGAHAAAATGNPGPAAFYAATGIVYAATRLTAWLGHRKRFAQAKHTTR